MLDDLILVTDIGSTKTKALLLKLEGDGLVQVETADEPTTVESPHEDVTIGLDRAVDRISTSIGRPLREGRRFTVPYYTTSSAGGGLQILVIGLAAAETGRLAEAVTFGAGGVLLDSFAIDDKIPKATKIQRMSKLSPDLVIMAGGHEGGAVAGVVNMAHLLAEARPRAKYGPSRLPVVFCGNSDARPFVTEMLADGFEVHHADNIRPSREELNLRPAIGEVHSLFMEHVMQMAPGYRAVAEAAVSPVIPTPTGVEMLLHLVSKGWDESAVLVDMGGATTDIFSVIGGRIERTVSGNTGMSYSLSNILREAGSSAIMRHLWNTDEGSVTDRILEKTLFPTTHPEDSFGGAVEHACAAEGMRLAFAQHLELSYQRSEAPGFLQRLRNGDLDPAFRTLEEEKRFRISDIGMIIGAGGVLAHANERRAAWTLAQGFGPRGVTTLAVDGRFHSPHMGVLSSDLEKPAREYYSSQCLKRVCRVITPMGRVRRGRAALRVKGPGVDSRVEGGDFLFVPDGRGFVAGEWEEKESIPLLLDCRTTPHQSLPLDFEKPPIEISSAPASRHRDTVIEGPMEMKRAFSLAYPGEIDVSSGDAVEPGMLLGQNRIAPPRTYFVDVRRGVEYLKDLSTQELLGAITVEPGDEVPSGRELFRYDNRRGLAGAIHVVKSPVRGRVTEIVEPGVIRLQEIQDYDGCPHVIDVAEQLRIKPKHIRGFLKVRKGDFVHRDQAIAMGDKVEFVKSPTAGSITDIDIEEGTVTVQYVTSPVHLYCPIHGTVAGSEGSKDVHIEFSATRVEGVFGIGRDTSGPLSCTPRRGSILLLQGPITKKELNRALEAEVSGIVGPSIPGEVLCEYLNETPGVFLTGDEDLPAALIVLRGVGMVELEEEVFDHLSALRDRHAALFTTTRLRTGVERPKLLVQ